MTGWLIQKQQTCTCSGYLRKLEKILFSTGQITHRTVDQFFLKTIGFQVSCHLIIGIKACILKILKDSGLLIKYLPMHLGKVCHLNIFAKTDCRVFSFANITKKGRLSSTVWSHNCNLIPCMKSKGNMFHNLPVKGHIIVFYT